MKIFQVYFNYVSMFFKTLVILFLKQEILADPNYVNYFSDFMFNEVLIFYNFFQFFKIGDFGLQVYFFLLNLFAVAVRLDDLFLKFKDLVLKFLGEVFLRKQVFLDRAKISQLILGILVMLLKEREFIFELFEVVKLRLQNVVGMEKQRVFLLLG